MLDNIKQYDVIIVGGGPAGTTTAMALEQSGLKTALLDKDVFPRDKICGDFIAIKGLKETFDLKPELKTIFKEFPKKAVNRSTHFYVDKYDPICINWVTTSYTIKRIDFDNVLMEQVKKAGVVEVIEGEGIKEIERTTEGFELRASSGATFQCRMLIGADGAHSVVAKKLAGYRVNKDYYGGSVRAYYNKLESIDSKVNEVYIHRQVVPGYFWLFPLSGTQANVGLGMHSRFIAKNKINLKQLMLDFVKTHPVLKKKFNTAEMDGKIEGFGLPFYSKRYALSGEGFLLTGDAGSLMDPSNGEGIIQAIVSGKLAAKMAIAAFKKQDFSASFLKTYEDQVHKKYWAEMRFKTRFVKIFGRYYGWLKFVGWLNERSPMVSRLIKRVL